MTYQKRTIGCPLDNIGNNAGSQAAGLRDSPISCQRSCRWSRPSRWRPGDATTVLLSLVPLASAKAPVRGPAVALTYI